ncbi:hypothetical protein D3Z48_06070 [Clostridiaceae bacterium]|nr:hypothetical protein [Clostridiaceae bacterium]
MKKILSLLLALTVVLSLAACGGSSDDVQQPVSTDASQPDTQPDDPEIEPDNEQSPPDEEKAASISEQVLLDESGLKITANGLESGFMGAEVKLLIENNSDQNLTFQVRNVSANGYMVDTMFSPDVAAGKKANETITLLASDLNLCGIETIADIELSFHIFTTEEWEDYLNSDTVQIKTSAADGFSYEYDDSGELLYEGNGIRIITKGLASDASFLGSGLLLYIENNSDQPITVQSRDLSVNGFMVDGMLSEDVMPGKKANTELTLPDYELEENGITAVSDLEFSFHIFNANSWDDITDTDKISLTF